MSFNTLSAYEQYMIATGSSLFEDIVLPDSTTQGTTTYTVNKDTLIETIIQTSEEFPVTYDNPSYLKWRITTWFKKYQLTFNKWWYAIHFDYEPLYNFDRYETSTDHIENSGTESGTGATTAQDQVSAYPNNDFSNSGKNMTSGTTSGTNASESDVEHTGHLYGNIGVTTSQQMLASEIELFKNFNFYQVVADMFVQDFCCMVY